MDVDLLRPGTVPISPDTSLWFEFLLDSSHLEKHLKNPNGDPTPTELITKFLTLSLSEKPSNGETITVINQKPSKRCLALKILALKVAAHLKWNLDIFEKSLTMANQVTLLKDFLYVVSPLHTDVKLHGDLNLAELPDHILFAILIYHRWVVRAYVNLVLNAKIKQLIEPTPEEINESEAEKSAEILKKVADKMAGSLTLLAPAPSCFALPTEEHDPIHSWSEGEKLQGKEVISELLMDLTLYLVNRGRYPEGRSSLSECMTAGLVHHPCMSGLCIAVGVRPKQYKPSLCQQFHECIVAKYINIDKVLEKDNAFRQIPIVYRQGLELDISSEVANGKLITTRDAVAVIRALNTVRTALDGGVQLHGPPLVPPALVKAISVVLPLSDRDKKKLQYYLLQMLATSEAHSARVLVNHISKLALLSQEQISAVMEPDYVDPVPSAHLNESSASAPRSASLEVAGLERLVLSCYDPSEIKTALNKLLMMKPTLTWDKLNRNWDIPMSLSNAIMPLPSGLIRNYVFILVAKSYELDRMKNYAQAKTLLKKALDEVVLEDGFDKLKQLLSFEILFVDIHQFHSKWPGKHLDWNGLTERCLEALPHTRGAVREAICLALLNTGAWGPLISATPTKSVLAEVYVAIARASLSLSQYNAKVSPEAWDKIIPVFATGKQRITSSVAFKTLKGLAEILEPNALSLVISLLTRLHNVLNDQPPLDLYVQLTHLWPGTIKNASQYNIKQVSESLLEILEHALEHYPYNLSWLKLMGDLHFVNGHYRSALSSYLEAAAVGTEHFSRPLHRTILEDHIIKRMIKSCTQLQCHTQAGLLCQLLEETDYTTAFKCLSESNPSDASDSYHQSIWDINILEFLISLHAKRGEHHRKQALVRMIGLLELNSNNNDEIKREAENIRKSHFLRAMASQYL